MKIVVGGQLRKDEIKDLIIQIDSNVVVEIKSDVEAAFAMQNGEFDFYVGACDTGGGGALAIAISLLGIDKTMTIATQSAKRSKQDIINSITNKVIAFGFVENEYHYAITTLMESIKEVNHG